MKGISIDKKKIETLCRMHHVENLYLFGSILTENFTDESDIDVLVRFMPFDLFRYFENYISLKENLEEIFGRNIDLVEEQSLKNPILIRNINKNRQQIYGRKNTEIFV